MKTAGIILILSIITLTGCTDQEKGNMLLKSGFEDPSGEQEKIGDWQILASSKVYSYDFGITEEARSGEQAYKMSRIWSDRWSRAGIETKKRISLDANEKYLLSLWYKTENFTEYTMPFTVRFMVHRKNHKRLNYNKDLSWSEHQWRQAYLLLENLPEDADSVQIQIYTRFRTKGSIVVDDISFKVATEDDIRKFETWRRQDIPAPLGDASLVREEGTGFFKLGRGNNRWWLLDPEGQATWSIGTMAAINGRTGNGNFEFYDWYKEEFGNDSMAFASMLFDTLKSWGFNSYAGWTGDEFAEITAQRYQNNEAYFPMYKVLGLSRMGDDKDYYVKDREGNKKDGDHAVVDPYNPKWREDARQKAMQQIPVYKDKPWFVGWYIDNELELDDLFKFVWAEYSGKEFISQLKEKYQTIENLNQNWSSSFETFNYGSFDEILSDKPEPMDWDDPLYTDFTNFERQMVQEYIDFTYALVKELDPNHLIISNRLHLGPMGDLHRTIDLWGKYDLICMNIYPENLLFGFAPGELELMKRLHEGTGKPVIIGEWSVPAMGVGLYKFGEDPYDRPMDWSWPQVVRSQKERGEVYHACMMQLASMDFILGAGWFKPIDVNSVDRRANRGLINGDFEPYTDMVTAIERTNETIHQEMKLP